MVERFINVVNVTEIFIRGRFTKYTKDCGMDDGIVLECVPTVVTRRNTLAVTPTGKCLNVLMN